MSRASWTFHFQKEVGGHIISHITQNKPYTSTGNYCITIALKIFYKYIFTHFFFQRRDQPRWAKMWRGNEKLKRSHFYGAFNNFVIQFHMIAIGSLNEYTLGEAFWNDNTVGIILRKYSHRGLFTRVLLKIVQWILQSKCWKNIHGRYVVLVLYSYKSNTQLS